MLATLILAAVAVEAARVFTDEEPSLPRPAARPSAKHRHRTVPVVTNNA
jgi:hypothetical protein